MEAEIGEDREEACEGYRKRIVSDSLLPEGPRQDDEEEEEEGIS